MLENNDQYFEVLNDIKRTLITTRNKIVENANKDLVLMYYNIGLKLIENNKWGSSFIGYFSKRFKNRISKFERNVRKKLKIYAKIC